ncbi:MAG: ribosome maturation factor RimP, partial [Vagococcus sp.]
MANVVEIVTDLVTPILDELSFELVDMEYVKEGKNWFLRVFIDKTGGIDINECALVSEKLGEKLDTVQPDPIPQAYFLEVSSPGAERPLKKEEDYTNA